MGTGAELRGARERLGLNQTQAAERMGVRRLAVIEAEKKPDAALGPKVAAGLALLLAPSGCEPVAIKPKAKAKATDPDDIGGGFRIWRDAEGRMFGKTAAETKAIRQHLADDHGRTAGVPLIPLRPDWRVLEGGRRVNVAIPDPLDRPAPAWAGARGVPTRSGVVYDYETAHRMLAP